jgi:F0F1-type ATP synthase assembly protein I
MLRWLRFLATQMQQHQQTVFFLEQLQPDWLADRRRRLLYQRSVRLVFGLVTGLLFGLGYVLVGWLLFGLVTGPVTGLLFGLLLGLLAGLLFGHTTAALLFEEREASEVGLTSFSVTSDTLGNEQQCALSDLS